jgi:hypothetical protein
VTHRHPADSTISAATKGTKRYAKGMAAENTAKAVARPSAFRTAALSEASATTSRAAFPMLARSSPVVATGIEGATATSPLPSAYKPQQVRITRFAPRRCPRAPAMKITSRAPMVGIWRAKSDCEADEPRSRSMSSRM